MAPNITGLTMACPKCRAEPMRIIYMGFPMWFCSNEECNCCWGFWSWVPTLFFNGWIMPYEGRYLPALWAWLRGDQ